MSRLSCVPSPLPNHCTEVVHQPQAIIFVFTIGWILPSLLMGIIDEMGSIDSLDNGSCSCCIWDLSVYE